MHCASVNFQKHLLHWFEFTFETLLMGTEWMTQNYSLFNCYLWLFEWKRACLKSKWRGFTLLPRYYQENAYGRSRASFIITVFYLFLKRKSIIITKTKIHRENSDSIWTAASCQERRLGITRRCTFVRLFDLSHGLGYMMAQQNSPAERQTSRKHCNVIIYCRKVAEK